MKSEGASPPLHQKEIKNLHFTDFQNIEFPVLNPDAGRLKHCFLFFL